MIFNVVDKFYNIVYICHDNFYGHKLSNVVLIIANNVICSDERVQRFASLAMHFKIIGQYSELYIVIIVYTSSIPLL